MLRKNETSGTIPIKVSLDGKPCPYAYQICKMKDGTCPVRGIISSFHKQSALALVDKARSCENAGEDLTKAEYNGKFHIIRRKIEE